jgi:P4 family phage/plasmid primase-like protien
MTAAANTSFPENSAPLANCDPSRIRAWHDAIRLPNEVINVRIPTTYIKDGKKKNGAKNVHCTGVSEIEEFIRNNPSNLYWANVQELDPSTLPRNAAASDPHIKGFRWMVVEFDPQRKRPEDAADFDVESLRKPLVKGEIRKRQSDPLEFEIPQRGDCAATDAEKNRAVEAARKAYAHIKKEFGVRCYVIDSGNGIYLYVPVDLENTPENRKFVATATDAFERLFAAPGVKIDTTAKNPSRVLGIPGTLNAKGANTAIRPHRMRELLFEGSRDVLVTAEQLTSLLQDSNDPSSAPPGASGTTSEQGRGDFTYENVEHMLEKLEERSKEFTFERAKTKYAPGWAVRCPNDAQHENAGADLNSSTVVWVSEDRGFANFRCLHAHCTDVGWKEFVETYKARDLQELITRPWLHPDPAKSVAWLEGNAEIATEPLGNAGASPVADGSSASDGSPVAAPFFSDIALAKRFAQDAKGKIAFLDRGVWTYCANGRWQDDDRSALHIRHTVSEFLLQQMPVVDELIPKGADKEETANARMRRNLKTQLGGAAKESSVRSQVQHQPGMFLRADQFDKNPFLLGAPGGRVIDLTTGATRPACPEDYLSKSVVCLPAGDCPQWLKFMEEITGGDADLRDYLQRMMGYWLTAEVREHCLVVLHGEGGNGKGTLIAIVQHILGDSDKSGYACTVPMDALMTKKNGETDLRNVARMCGARLVVAQESDLQRKFNSGLLKTLTGGDELTGEKKFEHPFNFSPTHKLVVVSNHRPKVDLDGGMKRRLHLVPFRQVYDLDKTKTGAKPPDRMLKEKLLAEAPGILAWMIKGCLAWQKRGLDPPASVLDYTTEFFADNDTLGEWIEQNCDKTDAKVRTPNDDLFADWKMFCSNGRGDAGAHAEFVENLRKRGFEKARIGDKRATRGLKIKSTPYSM